MTKIGDNAVECILEIEARVKADLDKLLETRYYCKFLYKRRRWKSIIF